MRRMLVLTIAGGVAAAYLAYPHGFLASALAYLLGGMLCALLGLLSYLYASGRKDQGANVLAPSRRVARSSPPAREEADL